MVTRRALVHGGIAAGAGIVLPGGRPMRAADGHAGRRRRATPRPDDDPEVRRAAGHPAGDAATRRGSAGRPGSPRRLDYYEIAVRQFQQAILPARLGLQTTVWSYGAIDRPGLVQLPRLHDRGDGGPAGAGDVDQRTGGRQRRLPAPPPAGRSDAPLGQPGRRHDRPGPAPQVPRDARARTPARCRSWSTCTAGTTPRRATAITEAWYLPAARNLPAGFAPVGTLYDEFAAKFADAWGQAWEPGTAVFQYANDQRPATLWFHDHTLGMTRLNVYAGPAGFYLLRGGAADLPAGVLPGPAPALGDAAGNALLRDPARHPGPLLHRGRRALLPGEPRRLRRLRRSLHPRERRARRSGTRRSSATRWSSTAAPGRCWRSSRAATACGS